MLGPLADGRRQYSKNAAVATTKGGRREHRLLDNHELLQGQRGEEVEGRVEDPGNGDAAADSRKNFVNSGDSAVLPTM
jgi:hypothetical protein